MSASKIFLVGIFLFTSLLNFKILAQEPQSEEEILTQWADLPDTVKIDRLSQLCWKNRGSDPEKALLYGNMAYDLAIKQQQLHKAGQVLNYIGVIHRNRGNYILSLDYYNRALKLAKQIKDSVQIAYSYNNIGGIYRLQNNFPLALENIYRAEEIFEKLGDVRGKAYCDINEALIYQKQKNYKKTKELYEEVISVREKLGERESVALGKNLLGSLYSDMGEYDRALSIYQEVLKLYIDIGDQLGIAASYGGIGSVYYKLKKYQLSLNYRTRALKIHQKIGNQIGIILSYLDMGMAHAYLGHRGLAEEFLEKAARLAREINSPDEYLKAQKRLSEYYELFGENKEALKYYKRFAEMRDSIFTQESIDKITSLTRDYEITQNRTEMAVLKANAEQQENQRNYVIIILILIVIFATIMLVKNRNIRNINKQLESLIDTKDKLFHIIAHDVRNPFQTILSFSEILKEDYDSFSDQERKTFVGDIHTASKNVFSLLENLLGWARSQRDQIEIKPEPVNVNKEINDVFSLFSDQAKKKNIHLRAKTDGTVNAMVDLYSLQVVIRNLVNNAIKFSPIGGEISAEAKLLKGELIVTISDTGVGIPEKTLKQIFDEDKLVSTNGTNSERGTGLGLMLCKEFARKNGGTLTAESQIGKGTKVTFRVPSNTESIPEQDKS